MITKEFRNFKVTAETWETRNAWGHRAYLYYNNNLVNTNKITYYNRTWESWQYQSVIRGVIYNYIDTLSNIAFRKYKEQNNKKRLTQLEKQRIIDNDANISELKTWLKEL